MSKEKARKYVVLSAIAVFQLIVCSTVWAVVVTDNFHGQALIFPFYSAANQNTSLITIVNSNVVFKEQEAVAVKIRFLGAESGEELSSFNLYLGRQDSWVASVASLNNGAVLATPDASCLYPRPESNIIANLSEAVGSIEVIEMGVIDDFETREAVNIQDCDFLVARWMSGAWETDVSAGLAAPNGNLKGTLSLINVDKGTAYSFNAISLSEFSDIVQHTSHDSPTPNLSTAHDSGTGTNLGTTAKICNLGECVASQWPTPIEAVSASLMTTELHGEFVTLESIAASTEWILSYPTRKYHGSLPQYSQLVSLFLIDREGEGMAPPCTLPSTPYACDEHYRLDHNQAIEVIEFGNSSSEFGTPKTSHIVGLPYVVDFPTSNGTPVPKAGESRIGFNSTFSNSEFSQVGFPAIGIMLQEYENAFLPSNIGKLQRANYGLAVPLTRAIETQQ